MCHNVRFLAIVCGMSVTGVTKPHFGKGNGLTSVSFQILIFKNSFWLWSRSSHMAISAAIPTPIPLPMSGNNRMDEHGYLVVMGWHRQAMPQ